MADREKLIELLAQVQDSGTIVIPAGHGDRYEWVSNQKVADHLIANGVTIPVRCKDCKHWECWRISGEGSGDCLLDIYGNLWNGNDFCSYGEKREV